ncbi:tyrosine-type recombinase/integrase [Paenibacillus sp. LPE1-1-1.1]|uniref:tyrosine-type recombinase/integrase n=1 Tax=Paenibacillus sp. LPE1-1-1.1 TaxID=3135230 RepID=UPI003429C424
MNRLNEKKEFITSREIRVALLQAKKTDEKLFLAILLRLIGMRSSEIIAIRWCDVNFENATIWVRSPRSTKCIALPIEVRQELINLKNIANDEVGFVLQTRSGSQLSASWLRNAINRLSVSVGLPHLILRGLFKKELMFERMSKEIPLLKPFSQPVLGTNYYLCIRTDQR